MSTEPRKVRSQAVAIWKEMYTFLTSQYVEAHNKLGENPNYPASVVVPNALLNQLYTEAGNDPQAAITFWMATDTATSGCTPFIIISLETGAAISGSGIVNGQWVNDTSIYDQNVQNWSNFCMTPGGNETGYENDYVYMRLFSYKWENIESIINPSGQQYDLTLELVAHTVGAENAHFDTHQKDPNANYEGWLALDLLLTNGSVGGTTTHYDFVKPCPKICPGQQ